MYNISFARRLVSSQNSWPRCSNRLIETSAWKRLDSRFMSTYFEHTHTQKKIQEPAASKMTQQKVSVNYKEGSITHRGVAVVNSLLIQRPLVRQS